MAYIDNHGVEFSDDHKTLVKCPQDFQGEYVIPDGVTSIKDGAFSHCTGLTLIIIPYGVTRIGSKVFMFCTSLATIEIPDSVTSIGGWAFCGCRSLTSVTIPNSVTNIAIYAFAACHILASVTISDSVTIIGEGAFPDKNLKEICVPKGQKARFAQMDGLKKLVHLIVERDNKELTILLNIAKGYEIGIGVQKSLPQALITYMQAAEKGCAEAAYHLGEWYEQGEHVPQDLLKALEYFQQASKSGFSDAQTRADRVQNTIDEKKAEETRRQEEERKRIEEERRQEAERQRQEKRTRAEEQRRQEDEQMRKMEEEQLRQRETHRPEYLFFDTETTGVPRNYKAPVTNSTNWPRLVQIAWLMADKNGNILKRKSVIIKPDGFSIPSDASAVHGITTERAQREGNPLDAVLEEFMNDVQLASSVVGHNIDFDMHIVGAELYRLDMDYDLLMDKPCICTMKSSTDFCAIPNPNSYYGGYKWPSLQELYRKLFNSDFADAHDALADITATKECFFELRKRGII